MLQTISLRDFVIVDKLELDFSSGFTVLTGETGAGKSILLDALGLVLGERADSSQIREGSNRAEISALFRIESELVKSFTQGSSTGINGLIATLTSSQYLYHLASIAEGMESHNPHLGVTIWEGYINSLFHFFSPFFCKGES